MGKDIDWKFSWRAFASVLTGLSFLGMAFTGVILFVVPPGRIANWTGWTMLGLTKHQWIGLHDWFSIIFVIGAVLHIYLNWKPLVSYFKGKITKTYALRLEWLMALVVCVVVFLGTLGDVRPFSSLLTWNEAIKHGYDTPARQAPIPHAELLTLTALADQVEGVDLDAMLANLDAKGIKAGSAEDVVGELAEEHNITPVQLYDIAIGQAKLGRRRGAGGGGHGSGETNEAHGGGGGGQGASGRGLGRLTLRQYCADLGIDVSAGVNKLKEAGLEANPDMTIRAIADSAGVHPSEIRKVFEPTVH
jgi:uncharacterized membrane protein YgcG